MLRLEGLHRAVEAVDREVARLAAHASADDAARMSAFRTSWGNLVDLLALGPPGDGPTVGPPGADPHVTGSVP
jgi:hypothetical protein